MFINSTSYSPELARALSQVLHQGRRPFVFRRPWVSFLPLILTLAACSNNQAGKTSLVVYSTHGKELLTEYETLFEKENPDSDVKWLDMGSQDVLDRLRSEKENPQTDLWWGAPSTLFQQAEKEGLLQTYKPTWASQVLPEARSQRNLWYGTYETPEVIAYNSAAVKPEEAPQDWDDLLNPRWRNKIIMRDPLASGTMRTIFCAMILRFYRTSGSPDAGYQWLKKLDANTKDYVANLTLLSQKLARQEGWVTVWNMPDIELQRSQYNYPLAYVIPKSGTPVVTEGIALVAHANHAEAAKRFYEFVTNKPSLILAAHKFYRIPCRKDIPVANLPEWINKTPVRAMAVDWNTLEEKSNEWMKYWDTHIRHKGKL
ncbi:MAG: iron ABC transporter substrate-binding protein [Acidobacteria bacterium]|nr:MAG: iron ABC transporter substrate-binding protein [Acidobacteriota bacterium]